MIYCIEIHKKKDSNSSTFLIEPLHQGQAITLGNSLRRNLLTDVSGIAVTGIRLNNIKHEFQSISGCREDTLEVLLNLKSIILKDIFIFDKKKLDLTKQKAFCYLIGPCIVTANSFKLPPTGLQIVNKKHYITTIVDSSSFYCELDLERGNSYLLNRSKEINDKLIVEPLKSYTLNVDSNFNPVTRVNYKIRLIHDSYGNLKESLVFEIETNGSVTPKRILQEAFKNLITLFTNLFLTEDIINFSKLVELN